LDVTNRPRNACLAKGMVDVEGGGRHWPVTKQLQDAHIHQSEKYDGIRAN